MKINYRQFSNSDVEIISVLIKNLYKEDSGIKPMTEEKIMKTFDALKNNPDKGTILVIENEKDIIGYSILINFWSNEYGGNILFIDELFIRTEFRGQGIGTDFIKFLKDNNSANAVALQLHVTSANIRARKLYESLGFTLHKNDTLTCEI